jgi:hypothetical protein
MIRNLIFISVFILSFANNIFSADQESLWGVSKDSLLGRLKPENCTVFRLQDKPEYSNRIIDFFNSMNSDSNTSIVIVRHQGKPEIDYCFFNEKLYLITEEWNSVETSEAQSLLNGLKQKYLEIPAAEKKQGILYSFKKDKTKVLLHRKALDSKLYKIRIFYYSTDLFCMLLND